MSPKFSIDGLDLQKVLKGLLIGLAGVGITVLSMFTGVSYHLVIANVDLSAVVALLASALISTLINLLRKFVSDNSK